MTGIRKSSDDVTDNVVAQIVSVRRSTTATRSVLVAVTGIDGCGKGYMTTIIDEALSRRGFRVAIIKADSWLNLPAVRFNSANPGAHFYLHAIRFNEMFSDVILPLQEKRSVRVVADLAEETGAEFRKQICIFSEIDIILLEGIFLLKREFQSFYDYSIWIECGFTTALERAIVRAQEGLPPAETIRAYETIYFPAQRIHLIEDRPARAATIVLPNDSILDDAVISA